MRKRFLCAGLLTIVMSTAMMGCGASDTTESAYALDSSYDTTDAGGYYMSDDLYMNSSASKGSYDDYEYETEYMDEEYTEEAVEEYDSGTDAEMLDESASNRKLIRNVSMDVETEQFDALIGQIEEKTKALGGYIEDSYTYNGRSYRSSDTKNANLTIRIPSVKLDEFLSSVSEKSNVTSKNETVTDVTLQYVDLESHKKALEAEQERLLEMIEQAETVEDMITIESRLSEVRYQLESQESQLRTFDNQIQYSTVYLNIAEVEKYTPVAERTFFEKISDGFSDNLAGVIEDLVNFVIWFISSLPYLVVWGIIIVIAVKLIGKAIRDKKERKVRGIDRKTQKAERKAKKAEKKAAKKAARIQKTENEAVNAQKAEENNKSQKPQENNDENEQK
ncbi:MAG: DUF4349 domain-containing protein [Lachnospiraceae bacterium]|nr:DUF4349 domain-containing protein [Lachnospiraceae bacterium]